MSKPTIISPPLRKLLFALLLPLVLLFSQQGAVTHEIGHTAEDVALAKAGGAGNRAHRAGDLQCDTCLAFAHLAGVVTAHVVPPALLSFSFPLPANEAPVFIAADAPAARSRGPPTVL